MTTTELIKPLETWYAGTRFRSRTEARWAVFFDAMKIEWRYEKQGYVLARMWSGKPGTIPHLPDFFLPGLGLWVQVKGEWTAQECERFLDAAAALSMFRHDVLLLGDVPWPHGGRIQSPVVLSRRRQVHLTSRPWFETPDFVEERHLALGFVDQFTADSLLAGVKVKVGDYKIKAALQTARSARFEFGESG